LTAGWIVEGACCEFWAELGPVWAI